MSATSRPKAVVRAEGIGFTRGFACAVAALINMHGCDSPAKDLFKLLLPKDRHNADPEDLEVFRREGLMK